jgi:hypothetical protein
MEMEHMPLMSNKLLGYHSNLPSQVTTSQQGEYPTTMQNKEFATHFTAHWCFNCFSQMPNWVRMKFGQQVNTYIIFPQKTFQRHPHHHFGFMIKFVNTTATGNFVAPVCVDHFAVPCATKCSVAV